MWFTSRPDLLLGLATGVSLTVFLACNDAPTAALEDSSSSSPPISLAKDKPPKPSLHYARVNSDGTLVDGTALSASRTLPGSYLVTFPPPVDLCAGSAISASFEGFDGSAIRVFVQIGVGVGAGGAFDDESVQVNFFSPTTGLGDDTSFNLILVCP